MPQYRENFDAGLSFRGALTSERAFVQQNRLATGVVVLLILIPPPLVALLGAVVPAWASVAIGWFVGLLTAVVGLRAVQLGRERQTS